MTSVQNSLNNELFDSVGVLAIDPAARQLLGDDGSIVKVDFSGSNITLKTPGTGSFSFTTASNGDVFSLSPVPSAVNSLSITNAITGTAPTITAGGSDTDVDINIVPRGAGQLLVNGSPIGVPVLHTASGTLNDAQIQVIHTSGAMLVAAQGANLIVIPQFAMFGPCTNPTYTGGGQVNVRLGLGNTDLMAGDIASTFFTDGTQRIALLSPYTSGGSDTLVTFGVNQALWLIAGTADFAGTPGASTPWSVSYYVLNVLTGEFV